MVQTVEQLETVVRAQERHYIEIEEVRAVAQLRPVSNAARDCTISYVVGCSELGAGSAGRTIMHALTT
jgi:hypothetical protein